MDMMNMLAELTAAFGPSGAEKNVAAVIEKYAANYCDEVRRDTLGNLICHKKGSGPRVMFSAHMDSIGLVATHIDEDGFVKIAPVGGIDHRLLLSARLRILGREEVPAVVSCLAPHLSAMEGFKKAPPVDKLYLDTGFGKEELERLDCDTVGGLVFALLPVIPEDGSRPVVEAMGLRIRVEELCERRVEWALVEKLEPAEAAQ